MLNVTELIGFAAGGSSPPVFIASASTQNPVNGVSTLVINIPVGTAAGDIMIAFMAGAAGTWTGDTGWTEIAEQGSGAGLRVAYKIATGSEPASYTFTCSSSSSTFSGSIVTYRGATYDTVGAIVSNIDPITATSINVAANDSILLFFGTRRASGLTLTTPTGMAAVVTDSDAVSPSYIIASQTVPIGATGTRSATAGSNTNTAGVLLSIKPI